MCPFEMVTIIDDGSPDELRTPDMPPEEFQKLYVSELVEQLVEMVHQALAPGLLALTGNCDFLPPADPPRRQRRQR